MPVFKYEGLIASGKMKQGSIDAKDEQEAIRKLRKKGINVRTIQEGGSALNMEIELLNSVKTEHFVAYCRQFATLVRSGVTIVEATGILAEQTESKPLKKALGTVEEDIRNGVSLSQASAKHEKVFPPIYINMVRAGEATGDIDDTLERLADDVEKQYKIKKKVQSAMIYPAVLFVITILVAIFMMVKIVPEFVGLYQDLGAELPAITKVTLAISNSLTGYWWVWLIITIAIIIGLVVTYKRNEKFRYYVAHAILKMPVFGLILQKFHLARMLRTLSTLIASSVPILEAINITKKVVDHPIATEGLENIEKALQRGGRISDEMEKFWLFPPLVTSMTAIGENTGQLDDMLDKVAQFYEDDVDRSVEAMQSLIEPLMIVLLAVIVGLIIAAVMLPMFNLYEELS